MAKTSPRGFTLIELLVVIAIIGILSAVVLVSLNTTRAKARDAKRLADMRQIRTALALYYNDNGAYPPDVHTSYRVTDLQSYLVPQYLPSIPQDPQYGNGTANSYGYGSNNHNNAGPPATTYTLNLILETDSDSSKCRIDSPEGASHWYTPGTYETCSW